MLSIFKNIFFIKQPKVKGVQQKYFMKNLIVENLKKKIFQLTMKNSIGNNQNEQNKNLGLQDLKRNKDNQQWIQQFPKAIEQQIIEQKPKELQEENVQTPLHDKIEAQVNKQINNSGVQRKQIQLNNLNAKVDTKTIPQMIKTYSKSFKKQLKKETIIIQDDQQVEDNQNDPIFKRIAALVDSYILKNSQYDKQIKNEKKIKSKNSSFENQILKIKNKKQSAKQTLAFNSIHENKDLKGRFINLNRTQNKFLEQNEQILKKSDNSSWLIKNKKSEEDPIIKLKSQSRYQQKNHKQNNLNSLNITTNNTINKAQINKLMIDNLMRNKNSLKENLPNKDKEKNKLFLENQKSEKFQELNICINLNTLDQSEIDYRRIQQFNQKPLNFSKEKILPKPKLNEYQLKQNQKINPTFYSEFMQRRNRSNGRLIDLGVLSLSELMSQIFSKQLIETQVYYEFVLHNNEKKILQFLQLFNTQKIQKWNFHELKFTQADHRRLSQLLVKLYPQQYIIYTPHLLNSQIHSFTYGLYKLTHQSYKEQMQFLDSISKLTWWKLFQIKYHNIINLPITILPYRSNIIVQKQPRSEFNVQKQINKEKQQHKIKRNFQKKSSKHQIFAKKNYMLQENRFNKIPLDHQETLNNNKNNMNESSQLSSQLQMKQPQKKIKKNQIEKKIMHISNTNSKYKLSSNGFHPSQPFKRSLADLNQKVNMPNEQTMRKYIFDR